MFAQDSCPAGGRRVTAVEKVERRLGRIGEDRPHLGELGPGLVRAAETQMREADAQRRHHRARLVAAIEDRGDGNVGIGGAGLIDDGFEPGRPHLQRRTRRAGQDDGTAQGLGGGR